MLARMELEEIHMKRVDDMEEVQQMLARISQASFSVRFLRHK